MTVLVDWQIEKLCLEQNFLEPYDPAMLNPASIDLRIGNTLKRETIFGGWKDVDLLNYSKEKPYWLYPKQFILAGTLEVFNMTSTIAGEFKLKSSRAREGYEHLNAGFADPQWNGSVLTMEIFNVRCFKRLPIYPGLRIGQFIVFPCEQPRKTYQATGRYNGDRTVMASKG